MMKFEQNNLHVLDAHVKIFQSWSEGETTTSFLNGKEKLQIGITEIW